MRSTAWTILSAAFVILPTGAAVWANPQNAEPPPLEPFGIPKPAAPGDNSGSGGKNASKPTAPKPPPAPAADGGAAGGSAPDSNTTNTLSPPASGATTAVGAGTATPGFTITPTNGTAGATNGLDFSGTFITLQWSAVTTSPEDGCISGCVFSYSKRLWLCLPVSALDAAGNDGAMSVIVWVPDMGATKQIRIDGLKPDSFFRTDGAPGVILQDITTEQDRLLHDGVAVPPLEAVPGAIPGMTCAAIWHPCSDPTSSIEVRRIKRLAEDGLVVVEPLLDTGTDGAGLVSHAGGIVAVCNPRSHGTPESTATPAATIASAIDKLPRPAQPAPPTREATPPVPPTPDRPSNEQPAKPANPWTNGELDPNVVGWNNPESLAELLKYLDSQGYGEVVRWQLSRLTDGMLVGLYDTPDPTVTGSTTVSVVSESKADDLGLRVWRPTANQSPDFLGEDRGPSKDAAVLMRNPSELDGAAINVWDADVNSNARVLLIESRPKPSKPTDPSSSSSASPNGSKDAESASAASRKSVVPPADPAGPVVIIPLHDGVGAMADSDEFFTASDFQAALDEAYAKHPSVIVLDVDSGGGRVDTKEEIVRAILTGSANGQRFAAVIHDAGSAAALIAMACPEWFSFPGARVGAAVTITSTDEGTVSFKKLLAADPELKMKYESFSDALDKEAALATNRSTAISAAMKSSEAELWWDLMGGFSAKKNGEDAECLDGANSVLTLTNTQLVRTGLAQQILLIEQLPRALGLEESRTVIQVDRPMRATIRQLKDLVERYEEASPSGQQEIVERANQIFERP